MVEVAVAGRPVPPVPPAALVAPAAVGAQPAVPRPAVAAEIPGQQGKPAVAAVHPPNHNPSLLLTRPPHNSSSSSISPSYGGGKYYGGGATSPYRAGGRSPGAGIVPFALVGGIAGAALIFPGVWAYGAYNYPYSHPYSYHNRTNTSEPANQNETLPVTCLCQMYSACGCDDNANSTYLDGLVGDGSPGAENSSLVHVGPVNGTKTVVLNGTLPNGTDTDAAPAAAATTSTSTSGGAGGRAAVARSVAEGSGVWLLGGMVGAAVWML